MPLRYPLQKICLIPSASQDRQLLLGASGCTINCISLSDGEVLCQWPAQRDESDDDDDDDREENDDRPNKKRKLDSNGHNSISRQPSDASDASLEIVAERKKGERKKSKFIDTRLPNVSHLLATSDGKHAIAVTAEDKAIRVFRVKPSGRLEQLSQRSLPKKLCAVRLTKDEKTILAADKFGDVYAVPLHQSEGWTPKEKVQDDTPLKPSATELTVHTKGNLEALRQQLERKQITAKREGLDFEHQLLLGHVSLLTDLVVAEGMVEGKSRPFILTSDRDEHIRVSRGMPQAHVIENFCLGHQEFITKLCIPPSMPSYLIAGNGEVSLRLYDWLSGELLQRMPLSIWAVIDQYPEPPPVEIPDMRLPEGRAEDKLAVSGIWSVDFSSTTNPKGTDEILILVAIEGMPFLMTFVLYPDRLHHIEPILLRGNVLDVVFLDSAKQVLVSIDTIHEPGSMKRYRDEQGSQETPFQLFKLHAKEKRVTFNGKYEWESVDVPFDTAKLMKTLPEAPKPPPEEEKGKNKGYEKTFSPLGEFLYGLENLRKKRGVAVEEEVEIDMPEGPVVDGNLPGLVKLEDTN